MSVSRSFARRGASLVNSAGRVQQQKVFANAVRAQQQHQYRQYSNSSNSNANGGRQQSTRAKTPIAFGLVGLGGLTSWLGFGGEKDPKTTQEGMLGDHPDVDYGAVYRDVGELYHIILHYLSYTLRPSTFSYPYLSSLLVGKRGWAKKNTYNGQRKPWTRRVGGKEQHNILTCIHFHHPITAAIMDNEGECSKNNTIHYPPCLLPVSSSHLHPRWCDFLG